MWGAAPPKRYRLNNVQDYERLAAEIELFVQKLLEEHNYDTVGNFLDMYRGFKRSGAQYFFGYFQNYSPPITAAHHTCVGLALELWTSLSQLDCIFPHLSDHLHLVSCEENIEYLSEYTALSERLDVAAYDLEKEHVLLCLEFELEQNGRNGLLLCDPGYHVGRVITVMHDKAYPHTGCFIQCEENQITKEYNYQYSPLNEKFIEWHELTTRNGQKKSFTGLIYIAHPYLTAVDVTERRNLVYNFRSLLSRDQKGHLLAGIYFKIKENCDEFTIFYQDMGKQRCKMKFSTFLQPNSYIPEKTMNIITICNEQLNFQDGGLLNLLKNIGELMNDQLYLRQLLQINESINTMSANN